MGTYITLGIENLEIDWGKNSLGKDHSVLFLPEDRKRARYFYAEGVSEFQPAYVRRVDSIRSRLDLLGYTLDGCRRMFDEFMSSWLWEDDLRISFDTLSRSLLKVNVPRVSLPQDDPRDFNFGQYVRSAIFADPAFVAVDPDLAKLDYHDGEFLENIDPYIVLRLIAENPSCSDRSVIWRFQDIVDSGWVEDDQVYSGVPPASRFLIVTEGSSDAAVLKKALPLVAPGVKDFFDFVDMSETYPFTGTGNVVKFCQGLARIGVLNRVLVVLDNDAAGVEAYLRLEGSKLPTNIQVMTLPDLADCRKVATLGPTGVHFADINGKAASIEWFLDLRSEENPTVRWTGFNPRADRYQGELVNKESHVRRFLKAKAAPKGYDLTKLGMLWQQIQTNCSRIASTLKPLLP
jgi:hypothetical protein